MWIQPQDELPGREPLAEGLVHVRRERTFLWLAAFFIAAAVMLPLLGMSKWFGASSIVRAVGVEPPVMLLVPLGVIAWPLALLALNSIGELYGASRMRSIVFTLVFVWLGVLGLSWATDHIADYDNRVTSTFFVGAVLVASGLLALIVQLALFAWIGARWLRHVGATLIAIAIGWGAFFLALRQLAIPGAPAMDEVLGVALGAGGYSSLVVLIGTLPALLIARGLAVYLRVELRGKAQPFGVDEDDDEPAFTRRPSQRQRHFTHEELAFFEAGESELYQPHQSQG